MSDSDWKKTVSEKSLQPGKPVVATVDDQEIMLVRIGDRIAACGNKCSHYGGPLNQGLIVGDKVICPWHNARFEVSSGAIDSPPGLGGVASYEVKTENGEVFVRPREQSGSQGSSPSGKEASILILGAGAAGDTAADSLRSAGFKGKITLVTQEEEAPYDRTVLSKGFISGEAKAEWLPLREQDFYRKGNVDLVTGKRIVKFEPESKTATLDDGTTLQGDQVLLCTGSVPRKLDLPGSNLPNVFYLRSMKDAQAIVGAVKGATKAVIIGASFIGLETASGLRERKIDVHILAPEEVPLAGVFGERVGKRIQRIHEENGVSFHLGRTAKELQGSERVSRVTLDDGTTLDADLVIIGAGVTPAVDYLKESGLLENGAVPVNGRLETKFSGVFAAGDIAVVPEPRSDRTLRIEHWVVAQRHGMHAAQAMLGSEADYDEPPFFWTMQYGNSIKFTGSAAGYDEIVYRGDVDNDTFSAGYFRHGKLCAVSTIGRGRDVLIAGELLKEGVEVTPSQFKETEDLETLLPA